MTQERATQGQPQVKVLQILLQEGKYGPNTSAQKMSNLTPWSLCPQYMRIACVSLQ
jgi:hypothetical protein